METALVTTIVSTGGAVITGVFGMFMTASQLGRRIDDSNKRIDELRPEIRELRSEFYVFKDVVSGKLTVLDTEIAKLMDRRDPH